MCPSSQEAEAGGPLGARDQQGYIVTYTHPTSKNKQTTKKRSQNFFPLFCFKKKEKRNEEGSEAWWDKDQSRGIGVHHHAHFFYIYLFSVVVGV